jgi:hypothetical protein
VKVREKKKKIMELSRFVMLVLRDDEATPG